MKLNREYEFTLVTKGELQEAEKTKVLEGYEAVLTNAGGEILRKDDWGMRKLCYPIKKSFRGGYSHYKLASTPANIAEAERLIRIDSNVLRHLVIKVADEVNVEERKVELSSEAATKSEVR